MRNSVIFAAAALLALGFAGSASAQSAKFAASWDTRDVTVDAQSTCVDSVCDGIVEDWNAELEMAILHVGSKKSILVGVSSQIGIFLLTEAKGKSGGGGDSAALAEGEVIVHISLVDVSDSTNTCTIAPSSTITLKAESRKLDVKATATDGEITVFVGIETESVGAHHFEFLGTECEQGTYKLTALFDLHALAEASGFDSNAEVIVTLGDRMITMQEVRAVKGSLVADITTACSDGIDNDGDSDIDFPADADCVDAADNNENS